MKVQKIFGVVVDMDDTIDDKDDDDFGLLNCDLLKIGKPSWFRTLSCHGLGKVGAVFRAVTNKIHNKNQMTYFDSWHSVWKSSQKVAFNITSELRLHFEWTKFDLKKLKKVCERRELRLQKRPNKKGEISNFDDVAGSKI